MELENNNIYAELVNQYYSKLRNSPLIETTHITDPRELQYLSTNLDGTKIQKQLRLEQLKQLLEDNEVNDDNIDVAHHFNIMFNPSMQQYNDLHHSNKWKYLGVLLYNMDENQQYYDFLRTNFNDRICQTTEYDNKDFDIRNEMRNQPMKGHIRIMSWRDQTRLPVFYTHQYTEIDIVFSDIKDLDFFPKYLPNLKYLRIVSSNLQDISALQTINMPRLQKLEIFNNNISQIHGLGKFDNLEILVLANNNTNNIQIQHIYPKAKTVKLQQNNLRELDFSKFPNVEELDISVNNFRVINKIHLKHLKVLHLHINSELTKIKEFYAPKLEVLQINGCSEFNFQSTLEFPKLKELDLQACNNIQNIPDAPKLEKLNLADLELLDCNGIGKYPQLVELNLQQNLLSDMSQIPSFYNLEKLDLNGNVLTNLQGMNQYPNLETLNLNSNELSSLDGITQMPNLKYLSADRNSLQNMSQIPGFPNLETLFLRFNQIQGFEGMNQYPNLEYLNLKKNIIQSFRGMQQLPKLRTLEMQNNRLTSFKYLPNFPSVQSFDFSKNRLTSIQYLPQFQNIEYMYYDDNQIPIDQIEQLEEQNSDVMLLNNLSL